MAKPQSTDIERPALYLVATPIGNLEDITMRALRLLKSVDLIACEDTLHSQHLLNHFQITTRTISYHEHNELTRSSELVKEMEEGRAVALISDAGMPGISDPGYRVVTLAIRHHIPVIPVPGASAFVAAIAASGLPTDSFQFHGFLPAKARQRRDLLEAITASPRTEVFYEAPHRLIETMQDVIDLLGPKRPVVIAREVTKLHEEFIRGHAEDILAQLQEDEVRGEITLLIGKADPAVEAAVPQRTTLRQRMAELMRGQQLDEKGALKIVSKEMNMSKSEAYREWQRVKA